MLLPSNPTPRSLAGTRPLVGSEKVARHTANFTAVGFSGETRPLRVCRKQSTCVHGEFLVPGSWAVFFSVALLWARQGLSSVLSSSSQGCDSWERHPRSFSLANHPSSSGPTSSPLSQAWYLLPSFLPLWLLENSFFYFSWIIYWQYFIFLLHFQAIVRVNRFTMTWQPDL